MDKRSGEARRRDMLRRQIMDRRIDGMVIGQEHRSGAERRFQLDRRLYLDRRVAAASFKDIS